MIIETRFEIGEKVVLINHDKIITLPVKDIEYLNGKVRYSFCETKATTSLDKDRIIYRDEEDIFRSINQLADYYLSKNK